MVMGDKLKEEESMDDYDYGIEDQEDSTDRSLMLDVDGSLGSALSLNSAALINDDRHEVYQEEHAFDNAEGEIDGDDGYEESHPVEVDRHNDVHEADAQDYEHHSRAYSTIKEGANSGDQQVFVKEELESLRIILDFHNETQDDCQVLTSSPICRSSPALDQIEGSEVDTTPEDEWTTTETTLFPKRTESVASDDDTATSKDSCHASVVAPFSDHIDMLQRSSEDQACENEGNRGLKSLDSFTVEIELGASDETKSSQHNIVDTKIGGSTGDEAHLPVVAEITAIKSMPTQRESPIYTMKELFPVVYEARVGSGCTTELSKKPDEIEMTDHQQKEKLSSPRQPLTDWDTQRKVEDKQSSTSNRALKLQLSLATSENKHLRQRNARMKAQLAALTGDLQRTKHQVSVFKTENELYAAKVPNLQAELLEETSQVDEKTAESFQSQLTITQLRARTHVIQTQNRNLEKQNEKLQQDMRQCKKDLRRKIEALQQCTEKVSKLESDMNNLKTVHAQELLDWKRKMANALQRFDQERHKAEFTIQKGISYQLKEAKAQTAKAVKKRQELEVIMTSLHEDLKQCKRKKETLDQELLKRAKEAHTMEILLQKAHRAEATLRNQVTKAKAQIRVLHEEQKKRVVGLGLSAKVPIHQHRRICQYPIDLLAPMNDDSSTSDEDSDMRLSRHCKCCSRRQSSPTVEQWDNPTVKQVPCQQCIIY